MGPKRLHKAREANTAAGFGDRVWGHDRGFVVLSIWARSPCHVSCGHTIHWKFHAAHVQHTCKHTCNTTTLPVNLRSKCPSGNFRRPKAISKGKENILHPWRENQRNLQQKCFVFARRVCTHVCCTWLHVFSQVFPLRPQSPWLAARFGAWCGTFVAGARFWVASTHFRAVKAGVGNFGRQAQVYFVSVWEPCDSSLVCSQQAILPVRWAKSRTKHNSRSPPLWN